jgi:hypothetical protein
MSQRTYLDSIGRQISKRTPNMRSLVMQEYITEKNRIIVLSRDHAEAIERRRAGRAPRSNQVLLVEPPPRPPVRRGRDGRADQRRTACSCRHIVGCSRRRIRFPSSWSISCSACRRASPPRTTRSTHRDDHRRRRAAQLADMIVEGMVSQPDADEYLLASLRQQRRQAARHHVRGVRQALNETEELLMTSLTSSTR